jgi:hypothetical protein
MSSFQMGSTIMKPCHLRVYHGPQEEASIAGTVDRPVHRHSMSVPLMEILPLLADAYQADRAWLRDFSDDEVTISMDLYEVLLAYQHYRRPVA